MPASITNKTWRTWMLSQESADIINKSQQESLFKTFDFTVPNDEVVPTLERNTDTAFLFCQDALTANIFHHVTTVGGTIAVPKKITGFIVGVDKDATCIVKPAIATLIARPNVQAVAIPTAANLMAVASAQDVDTLQVGATTFAPRNFIPIPPFLLDTIADAITAHDGDLKELLVAAATEIRAFDARHTGDQDYTDAARDKCKQFVGWLYLAINDSLDALPCTPCTSPLLINKIKSLEEENLGITVATTAPGNSTSLEAALRRPMEAMASAAANQTSLMESVAKLQADSSSSKERSFKKIPPKYQHMLLVASSVGAVTNTKLNDKAMEFFNQPSVLLAKIYLDSYLQSENVRCHVSHALANALLHGCFLWANTLTPSGLAASVISSSDLMVNDSLHEGLVLDLSTKHTITETSLEKLTQTQILYPTTAHEVVDRIGALFALVKLFFEEISHPGQSLKRFHLSCRNNVELLMASMQVDKTFVAKLLFIIDNGMNIWLQECAKCQFVTETTTALINFDSVFMRIRQRDLHVNIPDNIKLICSSSKENEPAKKLKTPDGAVDVEKEGDNSPPTPRKRKVTNKNKVDDWKLRSGESWNDTFKDKSKTGPILSVGSKGCLKYHCKLKCFTDCPFKKSHCTLTGDDKTKLDGHIKECRGE